MTWGGGMQVCLAAESVWSGDGERGWLCGVARVVQLNTDVTTVQHALRPTTSSTLRSHLPQF